MQYRIHKRLLSHACILCLLLFSSVFVYAQADFKLTVSGEVSQPLKLSLTDIAAMPHTTIEFRNKQGESHMYNGVPVLDILAKAKVTLGKELHGGNLTKYVLIQCADGYEVVFSLAELDSSIADKKIILSDQKDGKALPAGEGHLRIIIDGEKKTARSCFQVTAIVVGQVITNSTDDR